MKKFTVILILFLNLGFSSCTDVIDVELQSEPPRLVVEASINWVKGTLGNSQSIKLSLSTPYFDSTTVSNVEGAIVKITNDSNGVEYIFIDRTQGLYSIANFVPILNQSYTLEINYNGETIIAKETLTSVSNISDINQSMENGFLDDVIGLSVSFIDPADINNFYMLKFQRIGDLFPSLFDIDDKFTDGNKMTVTYEEISDEETGEKELLPGDLLNIELYGISENYYNYIRLLIEQSENGGDPFSSIPAPLKGNCINPENPEQYAYGYFRLSQVDQAKYRIE